MAVVLRVLWKHHIRRYYYVDCCLFAAFYISWVVLVEMATSSTSTASFKLGGTQAGTKMVLVVVTFNTLFALKELVEARYGKRSIYWWSLWNTCDMIAGLSVYAYAAEILSTGDSLVPLAVCTTLFLTIKLLSYLRGFSSTGWLLSVLTANFRDVRGFLIILSTILVGFSVIFRLLFGETGDESFGSLRRSFLSTFELTITGTYDTALLFETRYTVLAVISFILAITCVLVVALNALISILGDSYARVQEHAVANRRRELASLIVEYMCLLPTWKRREIESQTTWFHTLLEVDADGSLHVQTDDWEGGMNALRRDIEGLSQANRQSFERVLEHHKADLDSDIAQFKKEVLSTLEDLAADVKFLRKAQSQGILSFDAKQNVAKAVRAVQSVGRKSGALFRREDS
jgi:Ion transport protein